jgi:hypothetical protein
MGRSAPQPVGSKGSYSELPRAGDAFDLVDTCHALPCAEPITMFLDDVRDRHVETRSFAAV